MERSRDNSAGNRTRDELMAVAAALFAEHGVEGVSLAEINRVAGQRNNSAVTYHFGSKAGLIEAIQRHQIGTGGVYRKSMLDVLESQESPDLRNVMSAAVTPVAHKVVLDEGGSDFILMLASLLTGSDWQERQGAYDEMWVRWRALANRVAPAGDKDREMVRTQLMTILVVQGFADWERRRRMGLDVAPIETVTEAIIDSAMALYSPRSEPNRWSLPSEELPVDEAIDLVPRVSANGNSSANYDGLSDSEALTP